MINSLIQIDPQLFYAYSMYDPKGWRQFQGSRIEHFKFGWGTVLEVIDKKGKEGSATFFVQFDHNVESLVYGITNIIHLSLLVFEKQKITRLEVCPELAEIINKSKFPNYRKSQVNQPQFGEDHWEFPDTGPSMSGSYSVEDPEFRAESIKSICKSREITHLIHFTRLSNLTSILEYGLLSRFILENAQGEIVSIFNDDLRLDGCRNAICLSIQFPSYQMFHKYRQMDVNVPWAVLLLDPAILWDLDCAFCIENAAARNVTKIPIQARKTISAFQDMFADIPNHQRDKLFIPTNYTTHPQAEVLVFNPIPVKYFKEIIFKDYETMSAWLNESHNNGLIQTTFDSFYFSPRQDFHHWSSKSFLVEDNYDQVEPGMKKLSSKQ